MTLDEGLDAVRRLLRERGEPSTDNQRTWITRLRKTETLLSEAIELAEQVLTAPDDARLRRQLVIREGQARLALGQVLRGTETHRRNYDEAHGGTEEERRAAWREAKADRVQKKEGRVPRKNKRRVEMTEEEWKAHKREQSRASKARWRANKKKK